MPDWLQEIVTQLPGVAVLAWIVWILFKKNDRLLDILERILNKKSKRK